MTRANRIEGETWYEWARRLFEFENCAECGKGVRGHTPVVLLGHWFARCKTEHDPYQLQTGETSWLSDRSHP